MKRFAAAFSKQLAKQQADQHYLAYPSDMNTGDESPSLGPNSVDQNSSSMMDDDDMVITSENNIGTSSNGRKLQDKYLSSIVDGDVESFAPTRSSSPPIEHQQKNTKPTNNKQIMEDVSSPKNNSNQQQEEGKPSTGEALGSAFKRLKTRKKNLSFSKFSGNVCMMILRCLHFIIVEKYYSNEKGSY